MRLGLVLAAAALLAAFAAPAPAADAPTLRQAFSAIPRTAIRSAEDGILASVVDFAAAHSMVPDGAADLPPGLLQRLGLAGETISPFRELVLPTDAQERDKELGLSPSRIAAFAGYGTPPADTAIWILADEADARTVFATLPGQGFSDAGRGILINGAPYGLNLDKAQPGNPWRGRLGKTSAVARTGRLLIQAGAPDLAAAGSAVAAGGSLADDPAVSTALKGIEEAAAGAVVLQAVLVPASIGRVEAGRQAAPADAAAPLPPYTLALIADFERPGRERGAALAFAYPDCALAAEAASRFVARWTSVRSPLTSRTMNDAAASTAATRTVQGPAGSCAAVVLLTAAVPADAGGYDNPQIKVIDTAILQRDFVAAATAP